MQAKTGMLTKANPLINLKYYSGKIALNGLHQN
jgi:hypothetical protein